MRGLPGLGLLLVLAAPAFAEDAPAVDCASATAQPDLNACAYREYEAADVELNAVYKRAMTAAQNVDKELEGAEIGAVEALKKAQRGWVAYRDGQCELAGFQARGGQAESMLVSGCLAELTQKRTAELNEFLENRGN
ncbi:lysozyme inhibitor LprI family protein [Ensifer adhaerens]|uniref:lysozyme inhibitor LprI family protein n=1 Tax=Ensifer adhaerens TaxID=106592 RepID=UPI00098FBFAF|nr:lysozyme inhibitor LprI family protein [Ensifer adhaerens]